MMFLVCNDRIAVFASDPEVLVELCQRRYGEVLSSVTLGCLDRDVGLRWVVWSHCFWFWLVFFFVDFFEAGIPFSME